MSYSDPIRFDPRHTILEDLGACTKRAFEEKFPILLDPLLESCRRVQHFIPEYLRQCAMSELAMRFGQEFSERSASVFELRTIRYHYAVEADASENSLRCTFSREDEPIVVRPRTKTKRFPLPLTYLSVLVRTCQDLEEWRDVAVDITTTVVRAVDDWLERELEKANVRSSNQAIETLHDKLKREFGAAADQMLMYSFAKTDAGREGTYLLAPPLFQSILDRLKRGTANYISSALQAAALGDSLMERELTKASKVLDEHRGQNVVAAIKDDCLYEAGNPEFTAGEIAAYGPEPPTVHPLVYGEEGGGGELVLAYSGRLARDGDSTIPKRLEGLRPQILEVFRTRDVARPIIERSQRIRAGNGKVITADPDRNGYAHLPKLRQQALDALARLYTHLTHGQDGSDLAPRLVRISKAVPLCEDAGLLAKLKVHADKPEGTATVDTIERLLHSNV